MANELNLQLYKTIHMAAPGVTIASVSGSTGAYNLTLDNGEVITGYDETAGTFSTAAPAGGDLALFGILGGSQAFTAANCEVMDKEDARVFMSPLVDA